MATTNFYSSSDASIVVSSAGTWQKCHDATTGETIRTAGATQYVQNADGNGGIIERAFQTFDTSGIGSDKTITAATAYVWGKGYSDQSTNNWQLGVYNSGHTDTVVIGDYDLVGSTKYSDTVINITSFPNGSYASFAFNASGLSGISKTGKTKISYREAKFDATNIVPSPSYLQSYIILAGSGTAGTDNDPYLAVTYTVASGPANLKSWNGLAKADIKSINGLAIADIKSFNGLE